VQKQGWRAKQGSILVQSHHDAEIAGNFSFFHGCFKPSCVNFLLMNVSRFSVDTGPGHVATASLKACRGACSAPFDLKNGA
jgi:hypothetical protein